MNNIVLTDMDVVLFTTYNYKGGFFKAGIRHNVSIDETEVVESTEHPGVYAINVLDSPKYANDYIPYLYSIVKELVPSVNKTTLVIHDKDLMETCTQSVKMKVQDDLGSECYTVITFNHTSGKIAQLVGYDQSILRELRERHFTIQDLIDEIVQQHS